MKTITKNIALGITCFAGLAVTLTGCSKEGIQEKVIERPISTTVLFRVAQAQDYSSSIFDSIQAEVTLSLSLANKADGGGQKILWDTTIHLRDIRSYPEAASPLFIRKTVDGIQESREFLTASRVIRYVRRGSEQYLQASGEAVSAAKNEVVYEVNL